ncbi:hypothetical protein CHELA20_54410 [Hyphomicrobiales bacterium]|nr:hypothetical protein CHELA41_20518 [Hyphomicrobiales bacterium]CAH1686208.1 hypothetical protein CHELA20_54410 [Hyphomicrobiales bacterium]
MTARTRAARRLVKQSCSTIVPMQAAVFADVAGAFHLLRHGLAHHGASLIEGRAPL